MTFLAPRVVDAIHHENQIPHKCLPSAQRFCTACKKMRSIAQYWNAAKNPVHTLCHRCRGVQ